MAVLDNAEGELNLQNIISDSNLNLSDYFNGPFLAHYAGLQPTVPLRNIRANRNVSNKAAWFGVKKKEEVGFLYKKRNEKKLYKNSVTHCSIRLVVFENEYSKKLEQTRTTVKQELKVNK